MEINFENLQDIPNRLSQTIQYNLPGGYSFEPSYIQAGIIIFLLFLFILALGQLRRRFIGWQLKGVIPGIAFGFVLALIVEAILLMGGNSLLMRIFGWESAPEPVADILNTSRGNLVRVLGTNDNLSEEDLTRLRPLICE
jgi:hypothetical protein